MFYFSICALVGLFFPLSGWGFPWPAESAGPAGAHFVAEDTDFYNLQIQAQTMRFLSEGEDAPFRHYVGAGARLKLSVVNLYADYTYSVYEDQHYFRPYEANLTFTKSDGQWVIGRKLMEWDWADQFWNRGLWQPMHTDDALRPRWAGLTGVFRHFSYKGGQTSLFGSFVFIPNFAQPFENQDGKLVSDNPWFVSPPAGKIGGTNSVPVYKVEQPDWQSFLLPSAGARISYEGVYLSYIYKPMNQMRVKSPLTLPLHKPLRGNEKTGFLVDTPIQPVILQHHLASGGVMLESKQSDNTQSVSFRLYTSATYSHPEKHEVEKNILFFQPRNEWNVSAKGEIHIKDPAEETVLHTAYTHRFYTGETDISTLQKVFADIERQFFKDDLFQFSKAVSAGINHSIKFSEDQFAQIKSRLIYHLLNEYFLFSFYSSFTFAGAFTVFVSGDLLFSEFPFSFEQTQENIGIYTNKSRIFGGLKYDF